MVVSSNHEDKRGILTSRNDDSMTFFMVGNHNRPGIWGGLLGQPQVKRGLFMITTQMIRLRVTVVHLGLSKSRG